MKNSFHVYAAARLVSDDRNFSNVIQLAETVHSNVPYVCTWSVVCVLIEMSNYAWMYCIDTNNNTATECIWMLHNYCGKITLANINKYKKDKV